MTLSQAAELYVAHKRALGMQAHTIARILRSFSMAMTDPDVVDVQEPSIQAFLIGQGPITSNYHSKLAALRGFFRYLVARGHLARAPLPTLIPKQPPRFVPYIYARDELRCVLNAAYQQRYWCKVEDVTMHALVLLLYGAGLRISEAIRLTIADVDLEQGVLTIRDTKFYKTRLVPVGSDLAGILAKCLRRRRERGHPADREARFFVTTKGHPLNIQLAELSFKRLCQDAHVHRHDGSRFSPRLHDLRHSFAVHRLTAWYRAGLDVQRLLPHLATYLGHVDIGCTQRYLTMTPELLGEASRRFERYGAPEVSHA
jgi:integrase/recombinase XerD